MVPNVQIAGAWLVCDNYKILKYPFSQRTREERPGI